MIFFGVSSVAAGYTNTCGFNVLNVYLCFRNHSSRNETIVRWICCDCVTTLSPYPLCFFLSDPLLSFIPCIGPHAPLFLLLEKKKGMGLFCPLSHLCHRGNWRCASENSLSGLQFIKHCSHTPIIIPLPSGCLKCRPVLSVKIMITLSGSLNS